MKRKCVDISTSMYGITSGRNGGSLFKTNIIEN